MTTTTRPESSFASTLPGRYYYDPALYALEQERIFSQMWVCVGRAEQLLEPGAYQVVTVGQESVIVVRNRSNELQAFLNVCRHRGARICTEASGQLKGSLQCRYHAWTYGLDGRLLGAPNVLNDEQFDRAQFGLLPVALTIWEGTIWLNLSDNPSSLDDQLRATISGRFGSYEPFLRYGVGQLKVGKTITYEVNSNWKLIIENFMECYHCGPMHPELCDLLPGYRNGAVYSDGDSAMLADGVEAFTVTGKASRPHLPSLLPEDLRRYYGIELLPNMLLNLFHDHVLIHTLYPQAPNHTRIVCDWLFDPAAMQDPEFDPMDAVNIFDLVNRQDWEVCQWTQQGMSSKAYKNGGIYVPNERHIRGLCDFVLAKLGE